MDSYEVLKNQFISCLPIFNALGESTRLHLVESLSGDPPLNRMGLNVNEITRRTSLSRPAVSHHLKIMKDAGLVNIHRAGTSNYYYLTIVDSTRKLRSLCETLELMIEEMNLTE